MGAIRRVGRLRHRVEVLIQTEDLDNLGRKPRGNDAWTHHAWILAEMLELSGRSLELAKQRVTTATHSITTRGAWLDQKYRLLWRGRTLEIVAKIDGDGSGREITLLCGEVK